MRKISTSTKSGSSQGGESSVTKKFPALLRRSGFKATSSRLLILNTLEKNQSPMSAQNIIDAVDTQMNQVTVYRILKLLKQRGLIKQIDLRHNHAHYEIAREDEHHHLICVECGRVEDVHGCGVEDTHSLVIKHSKHFAEIKQHALEFYGICKSCSKK